MCRTKVGVNRTAAFIPGLRLGLEFALQIGDLQEKWIPARDQFERTISLQPGYAPAFVELAGVQYVLGSNDKAIGLLGRALKLDPDNSYANEFLANLLYLEDRKIEALEFWNKIDNPLPLRVHPTVTDEHKGKNPLGGQFILGNLGLRRNLMRWRVLNIKGQLFMDLGAVYKTPFENESGALYKDVGGGLIFNALGYDLIEILVGYDLNADSTNFWIGVPY